MAYYNFKTESSSGRAYYLGTLAHGATMNVAAKYEDYANLTAANFVIVPRSNSTSSTATNHQTVDDVGHEWEEERIDTNTAAYTAPTKNYNASTGRLSFSSTVSCGGNSYGRDYDHHSHGTWCYTYPSASVGLTADVYLLPEIESI